MADPHFARDRRHAEWVDIKAGDRTIVVADDVIFVEAGVAHRFEVMSQDFLTWVVFWGPPGGERQ